MIIFRTVISQILEVAEYEIKYGWTRRFVLYNFAVDDKIVHRSLRSLKVT
jgi:hypothetical protein